MITCQTAVVGGQQQKSPHVTLVTHASAVIVYALSRFCERVRVRVCVRVRACVCVRVCACVCVRAPSLNPVLFLLREIYW